MLIHIRAGLLGIVEKCRKRTVWLELNFRLLATNYFIKCRISQLLSFIVLSINEMIYLVTKFPILEIITIAKCDKMQINLLGVFLFNFLAVFAILKVCGSDI